MIGFDLWLQQRSFGIGRPVIAVMHSRQSKAGVCDKHEEHDNYAAIVLQRNTYSYCIYCTYCQVSQQISMETMGSQISTKEHGFARSGSAQGSAICWDLLQLDLEMFPAKYDLPSKTSCISMT